MASTLFDWAQAPTAPVAIHEGVEQVGDWLDLYKSIGGVKIYLGSILGAILLFVGFLIATAILRRALRRYAERNSQLNQSTLYTVERLLHYLLLLIGLLWALDVAGIPMAKMTVFAGALGVGLGFGLQAIFNNFVSGLILLFDRSLKVGDFVELASGVHGHVREIRIRATLISTNDDIDILVPNSEFVTGRVVNWTLREVARRQKISFGVAYGTDKELVKKAALEAAAEVPFTLSMEGARAPQVWLTGFGDSSLDFQLVVWLNAEATRRVGAVTAAYYWALHSAFEKYAIELPFPQRDLHVKSWVEPRPRTASGSIELTGGNGMPGNDAAQDVERDIDDARRGRSEPTYPHDPGASR
ncbi:mechanosensitive ion channel [Rhodanobacter sp. AS-Z3]|uniref:mechanosensitive ion channel family protein n=1 Tax=Rhodanobacter sp. AS-Z3 TaxID=3031330 RepID=UPI00247A9F65|nr:mechanosensitive ion channel domain-containing protein [Rhodanobacter sp. AS-Z3]WEN15981.1 mechanosensitive ion channel [Rhodanobacter sp. AS-Z3]